MAEWLKRSILALKAPGSSGPRAGFLYKPSSVYPSEYGYLAFSLSPPLFTQQSTVTWLLNKPSSVHPAGYGYLASL